MSLLSVLIAILIAGGAAYFISIIPNLGLTWKRLAYGVIVLFFVVWMIQQLRASGVDMTI